MMEMEMEMDMEMEMEVDMEIMMGMEMEMDMDMEREMEMEMTMGMEIEMEMKMEMGGGEYRGLPKIRFRECKPKKQKIPKRNKKNHTKTYRNRGARSILNHILIPGRVFLF